MMLWIIIGSLAALVFVYVLWVFCYAFGCAVGAAAVMLAVKEQLGNEEATKVVNAFKAGSYVARVRKILE